MNYLDWNDLLVKHYFDNSMAGREVLLYVNDGVIEELGAPNGAGVNDFIEAVKKGPEWATKYRFCQRALQTYKRWRERGLEYPPYVAYLVFFVLAAVTETDYAPHSYYPGLRKLLDDPQDEGMPYRFDKMFLLWDDLEKWSRGDRHEELGRFVARIRGKQMHVGLPRSQTVLSENERKHLPNIFDDAGLDPTDPPSPELIPQILSYYGHSALEHRTRVLLGSNLKESKVLKNALIELVLDELEGWNGTVLREDTTEGSPSQQVHTSLRLCISLDSLSSRARIYVRFKSSKIFPEEGFNFIRPNDECVWHCIESQRGWSTPLKDRKDRPPKILDGSLLNWSAGEKLIDKDVSWQAGLRGANVRLFRLGTDGLPDWVETQRLERGIEFLVACISSLEEKIRSWSNEGCQLFQQIHVTGLPPGWLLFHVRNATKSCSNIDILTLSTTVRLHLIDGIKAGKGNIYFKFAPPKIMLENSYGSETVTVNNIPLEQGDREEPVFALPESIPCGLPIRIEVSIGDQYLSKYIWLEEFDLPDSFGNIPFRNSMGDIISSDMSVKVCGAHAYGVTADTVYQKPSLTLLSEKIIFIGERPGEIVTWPDEPYPSAWNPVWALTQKGRNHWDVFFCGAEEKLKRISNLPTPVGDRRRIKHWKEVIWHKRKRYTLPEIQEVRTIWKDYLRQAQHV